MSDWVQGRTVGVAASAASLRRCAGASDTRQSVAEETRKIEKMVNFGAFWCMSQVKPSYQANSEG